LLEHRIPIVEEALRRFYFSRSQSYGLEDREQRTYDDYADTIETYSTISKGNILELGAGTWRIPETLARKGFKRVIALDFFSDESLAAYRAHVSDSVELMTYDGVRIPLPDASVEIVSSLCVFEHVVRVDSLLDEIDRVLRPGGIVVIVAPNWSGLNNPIRGLQALLSHKDRYWQYESVMDCVLGIVRSLGWFTANLVSPRPKFLLVEPRMIGDEINFERSDDDVVHLCQPLSFKKYFRLREYKILKYNRGEGESHIARAFNTLFPSLATTNLIVARKHG
jgi:SAM-dependent methyltransferase